MNHQNNNDTIQKQILDHLETFNKEKDNNDTEELIAEIAKRCDVSEVIVRQTIAELEAGRKH